MKISSNNTIIAIFSLCTTLAWSACSSCSSTTTFVVTALPNNSHGNLKQRIRKRRNVVTIKVDDVEDEDESSKQQQQEKETIAKMTANNDEPNLFRMIRLAASDAAIHQYPPEEEDVYSGNDVFMSMSLSMDQQKSDGVES
mmetsp:Transcript_36924/g.42536  ORF Transcript_36924/g.42536 Transcript_36924/m.42536 type:complete len:141 (-) Transcript_36924:277-699(-)